MNSQIMFWLNEQQRRIEGMARSNTQLIVSEKNIAQIVRLSHVSMPPECRSLKNSIPALKNLHYQASLRIREILDDFESEIARDKQGALVKWPALIRQCASLRGNFPQECRKVENIKLKLRAEKVSDHG